MICQVPILSFVPVLCIAVSVIVIIHSMCPQSDFEDNTLTGGENDRIAKQSEKTKRQLLINNIN